MEFTSDIYVSLNNTFIMKESIKKQGNNEAHLYGFINGIRMKEFADGNTAIDLRVSTSESFKKDEEYVKKYTNHDVRLVTKNADLIKQFSGFKEDIEKKGEEKVPHRISLDGHLTQSNYEKDDVKVYGYRVIADEDSIKLDVSKEKEEVMNTIGVKGNISNIQKFENSAIINIATHHYGPAGLKNDKGELYNQISYSGKDGKEVTLSELPVFVQARVNGNRMKEVFDDIVAGKIDKGDLIRLRGQMHENDSKNEEKKTESRGIIIDAASFTLIAKKAQKVEEKAEVQKEVKPAKKASTAKKTTKKGRTL